MGRVPRLPKVNIFNREICGNQKMIASANTQHSAVIADSAQHGALPSGAGVGEFPDPLD
jgi:hypothetical protein